MAVRVQRVQRVQRGMVAPFGRRFYREFSLLWGAPFRWMGIPADSGQRTADSGHYRPASPTHYCY